MKRRLPHQKPLLASLLATLAVAVVVVADDAHTATTTERGYEQEEQDANTCKLYMAESSIPNAGYGIFTTRTLKKGDMILANDGPNICVSDPTDWEGPHIELLENVWWGADGGMSTTMVYESADPRDYQIMFGALPNFHPYLANIDFESPEIEYDDRLANRSLDPGAGAFSYYTGKNFFADMKIEAGRELFLNYGESWLDHRAADFGHVARSADYLAAGKLIAKMKQQLRLVAKAGNSPSGALRDTVERLLQDNIESAKSERLRSILPKTYDELRRVVESTKSHSSSNFAKAIAEEISVLPRSVSWIRENGMCLDNIIPSLSTIPGAGRGAFAQRSLSKGERIVPVPLLHIADRIAFTTPTSMEYDTNAPEGDEEDYFPYRRIYDQDDAGSATGISDSSKQQLLVNYCFGHGESSLLLCPVTNSILINHCSDRKKECGPDGPNAIYQWASGGWDPNTEESLTKTVDELAESRIDRVLSMEIIALRDIAEGEEIFMDYGKAWEDAWEKHVQDWKPPPPSSSSGRHPSVTSLNLEMSEDIVVMGDLRSELPRRVDGVFTMCAYDHWSSPKDGGPPSAMEGVDDWVILSDDEILTRFKSDAGPRLSMSNSSKRSSTTLWPCSVISKDVAPRQTDDGSDDLSPTSPNNSTTTYTVRIFQSDLYVESAWYKRDVPCILYNYPRELIQYYTAPYQSDQHLPNRFRHAIEIRDEIFPEQWKNLNTDDFKKNNNNNNNTTDLSTRSLSKDKETAGTTTTSTGAETAADWVSQQL